MLQWDLTELHLVTEQMVEALDLQFVLLEGGLIVIRLGATSLVIRCETKAAVIVFKLLHGRRTLYVFYSNVFNASVLV